MFTFSLGEVLTWLPESMCSYILHVCTIYCQSRLCNQARTVISSIVSHAWHKMAWVYCCLSGKHLVHVWFTVCFTIYTLLHFSFQLEKHLLLLQSSALLCSLESHVCTVSPNTNTLLMLKICQPVPVYEDVHHMAQSIEPWLDKDSWTKRACGIWTTRDSYIDEDSWSLYSLVLNVIFLCFPLEKLIII